MGNVLEFALGLQTSDFLSKLGASSGEVLSFAGLMEGVKFSAEKMWGAVEQGAALQALAYRTDQSAQGLYSLQMGFKGVGLDANAVSEVILKMQRALSGANEMGESTVAIFSRLHLDMNQLRRESAAEEIQTLAHALAALDANDAAGYAGKIFGRGQAGDILQITRGLQEYDRVMNATRGDASIFGAMARAWQEIKGDAEMFESHISAVWAAIASGITPELHKVMAELNDITGKLGPAIAGAFQFGRVQILLSDALMAALEESEYYGERIYEAFATVLGHAVYASLKLAFEDVLPILWNGINGAAELASSKGLESYHLDAAKDLENRAADLRKTGQQKESGTNWTVDGLLAAAAQDRALAAADKKTQDQILTKGLADFNVGMIGLGKDLKAEFLNTVQDVIKSWESTDDPNRPHKALDKFKIDEANLYTAWMVNHQDDAQGGKKTDDQLLGKYKPEFTSFEKMGFVMGGGSNPMKRTEDLLEGILRNTSPDRRPAFDYLLGQPFTNQV